MPIQPILFEDHLVPFFRPLAWTQPLFEIRCGLFNARERIEIAAPRREGEPPGLLLGRGLLAGLSGAPDWAWNRDPVADLAEGCRTLWINGRLQPDGTTVREIVAAAGRGEFVWTDDDGLLVAALDADRARPLLSDWLEWREAAAEGDAWMRRNVPVPPWQGHRRLEEVGPTRKTPYGMLRGADEELSRHEPDCRPLRRIWDLVSSTGPAIRSDLELDGDGGGRNRAPFGLFAENESSGPVWTLPRRWRRGERFDDVAVSDPRAFVTGPQVKVGPFVSIDTGGGPVILDAGVEVHSHVHLEGPLYLGPGCIVKAGARVHGETALGVGCRVAGEIGESTFGDFTNKQHAGFIGHAVLGSWVNLGAMTTCSDLKNNYGNIRVDLGDGAIDTGLRFVGLLMGDHTKTAIGTLLNTGTCIGVASNIFGDRMPPKWVDSFSWGGQPDSPVYAVDRALATAEIVLSRRGCRMLDAHRDLLRALAR